MYFTKYYWLTLLPEKHGGQNALLSMRIKEGLTGKDLSALEEQPKSKYDVIIRWWWSWFIHCYTAKNHGIRNVAVLEKGHLGSGNITEILLSLELIIYYWKF